MELKFILGRFAVLALLLASQGSLFLWARAAVAASGWSAPTRRGVTAAVGVTFALFGALNLVVLLRPFAWVDPTCMSAAASGPPARPSV